MLNGLRTYALPTKSLILILISIVTQFIMSYSLKTTYFVRFNSNIYEPNFPLLNHAKLWYNRLALTFVKEVGVWVAHKAIES